MEINIYLYLKGHLQKITVYSASLTKRVKFEIT